MRGSYRCGAFPDVDATEELTFAETGMEEHDEVLREWFFEHPELLDPRPDGLNVRMRVWTMPTADVWRHWVVLEPGRITEDRTTWQVRMATRRRRAERTERERQTQVESRKAEQLSIGLHDLVSHADGLRSLLASLRSMSIPLGAPRISGLDGTVCGVEWVAGASSVRVAWWGGGPGEWRDLVEWHGSATRLMSRLFLETDEAERESLPR